MNNTVGVLKRIALGVMIAALAYASMAEARPRALLPDVTKILREKRVESVSVALIHQGRIVSTGVWGMTVIAAVNED